MYRHRFASYEPVTFEAAAFSASGALGGNPASMAFDGDVTSPWINDGVTEIAWVQADFPEPFTVVEYSFHNRPTFARWLIVQWNLQGSNDGEVWTVIDERDQGTPRFGFTTCTVQAPGAYDRYRFEILRLGEEPVSVGGVGELRFVKAAPRLSRPFPAALVSLVKPAYVFLERVSATRVVREVPPAVLSASLALTPGAEETSVDVAMVVRDT